MEFILQFFVEFLLEIPGAFLRWIILRSPKPFREFSKEFNLYNYLISFFIIVIIVLVIVIIS